MDLRGTTKPRRNKGKLGFSVQSAVFNVVFILCLGVGEVKGISLSSDPANEVSCRILSDTSFTSILHLPRFFELIWKQRSKDFWIWQLIFWRPEAYGHFQLWWWKRGISRLWVLQSKQSRYFVNPLTMNARTYLRDI